MKNFYIIGHNPNTLEEVSNFLKNGANAIEPDICYHADKPEKFYVHEDIDFIPDAVEDFFRTDYISLKEYLTELKKLLNDNPHYDLKLIAFDLKPAYEYDINELYKVIRENFSDDYPKVKIITTVSTPEAMEFLSKVSGQRSNEAIGVDEHAEPEEVYNFFKNKNLNCTFAAGSSFFSPGREKFTERISRALDMRENNCFNFVHVWCINDEEDMKTYLDMDKPIDAILTDEPVKLKELILSPEYSNKFTLDFENDG